MPKFDLRSYLERCVEIKATVMRLVPSIAVSLSKMNLDLSSVRYIMCSGAALEANVVAKLLESAPNTCIVQGYGYVFLLQ